MDRELITKRLNAIASTVAGNGLTPLVQVCDSLIPVLVRDGILELVDLHCISEDDPTHFLYNNIMYQLRVQEDTFDAHILNVAIVELGKKETTRKPKQTIFEIDSIGQFNKIKLFIPDEFPLKKELIEQKCYEIISYSYSWLTEEFRRISRESEQIFERAIWSLIRQIFKSNDKIISNIYIVIVTQDEAINSVDVYRTESLISKVKESSLKTNIGPARMVAEFIESGVPFDLSFSKQSIIQGKRLDSELSLAKYQGKMTIFQKSQMAIYDTLYASWQPLVKTGKNLLVAVYPTDLAGIIEPELNKNIRNFGDLVNATKSKFIGAWNLISQRRENPVNWGKVGQLIGGVMRAFVDQ